MSDYRILITGLYVGVLVIPVLVCLAFVGLARRLRYELPRWRSVMGSVSLALIFLGWLLSIGPLLLAQLAYPYLRFTADLSRWWSAFVCVAFLGTLLAHALRGKARAYALLAGTVELVLLALK